MLNLNNKIAVVSGCGSIGNGFGNGRAISTLLARQGAKVFGTDINEEAGQNTANFIKEEGNDFTFYKVNMTNENDVKEFFEIIEKKPITPQKQEIKVNPASRSAKLRYGIKLNNHIDFSQFLKKFNYLLEVENLSKKIWKRLFFHY